MQRCEFHDRDRPLILAKIDNIEIAVSFSGICCYSGVTAHRVGGRGMKCSSRIPKCHKTCKGDPIRAV